MLETCGSAAIDTFPPWLVTFLMGVWHRRIPCTIEHTIYQKWHWFVLWSLLLCLHKWHCPSLHYVVSGGNTNFWNTSVLPSPAKYQMDTGPHVKQPSWNSQNTSALQTVLEISQLQIANRTQNWSIDSTILDLKFDQFTGTNKPKSVPSRRLKGRADVTVQKREPQNSEYQNLAFNANNQTFKETKTRLRRRNEVIHLAVFSWILIRKEFFGFFKAVHYTLEYPLIICSSSWTHN